MRAFYYPGSMAGIETRRRQYDVRFDGWLPLSVREGRNDDFGYVIRIPLVGWHIVIGRCEVTR